ncbi:hypothetical protein J6590_052248 [Homalodisca vitripennis]|nr:hypothetical protein J6590_052248 [Homalodisca vitripennis]
MSDSIDSEMNTNEVLKRKRGIRNDDKYQRNVIKHKRLKGEEYTTKKGNLVPKATIGPDCKCRKKCFDRVNELERITLFSNFWDLD